MCPIFFSPPPLYLTPTPNPTSPLSSSLQLSFCKCNCCFPLVSYCPDCCIDIFWSVSFLGQYSFSSPSVFPFPCCFPNTVFSPTHYLPVPWFHLYVVLHKLSLSIAFLFINDDLNIFLSVRLDANFISLCNKIEISKVATPFRSLAKLQLLCLRTLIYLDGRKSELRFDSLNRDT